jgi:hypothetical protein
MISAALIVVLAVGAMPPLDAVAAEAPPADTPCGEPAAVLPSTPSPTPEPTPTPTTSRTPTPTPTPTAAFKARPFPLPDSVAWSDLHPADRWRAQVAADPPVDKDGLPVRRWTDGVDYYSPTNLGIQALRRLQAYEQTDDPAYLAMARRMADKLRSLAVVEGCAVWLPFPYDDHPGGMHAPWVNALAQASALALFSRLHRLEGDAADLEFAAGLFASFRQLRRPDGPWVSEVDKDGHLWFEHYPGGTRGHVLNAHAYAVLALRDYWQETRSPEARRWLEGGLTTLRDRGADFRREGTWSWYNLRDPVAHPNYHPFHIRELRALAIASGDAWFGALADLMASDFDWNQARHLWRRTRR